MPPLDASMKSDAKNAATAVETWMTDNPSTAVPAGTVAPATAGTGALDGFKSSTGNSVTLKAGATVGSYCIDVSNPGSTDSTKFVKYDSALGGLQPGWDGLGVLAR